MNKITYEELQLHRTLLQSIKEERYPHGYDFRPIEYFLDHKWVTIGKNKSNGYLQLRLTTLGQAVLDQATNLCR